MIILGVSPFNFAFSITPSSERFQWLFAHELTHITLADKPNKSDMFWRKVLFGKVDPGRKKYLRPLSGAILPHRDGMPRAGITKALPATSKPGRREDWEEHWVHTTKCTSAV